MAAKEQKNVRYEPWMVEIIGQIAAKSGLSFSQVVLSLLEKELNRQGYFKSDYVLPDRVAMKPGFETPEKRGKVG